MHVRRSVNILERCCIAGAGAERSTTKDMEFDEITFFHYYLPERRWVRGTEHTMEYSNINNIALFEKKEIFLTSPSSTLASHWPSRIKYYIVNFASI